MPRWFGKSRAPRDNAAAPPVSLETVGPITPEYLFAVRLAAAEGDQGAMAMLPHLLQKADVQELTAKAREGNGEDAYLLALALQAQGAKKDAARWLRTAAEGGVPDAAYDMAVQTLGGKDGKNLDKAEPWLRRAADGGHAVAAAMLGMSLGHAGRPHWAEAERYLAIAAEAGHVDCVCAIGKLRLEQGDKTGAEQWFLRAAEGGDADGANNYAVLLYQRDGDLREVIRWLKVAADGGNAGAADNLRKIRATLRDS